jgi:hypothetical protein
MSPLETHSTAPADSNAIPEDEDHAAELVDQGLRTAETEIRDAVTQLYVDEAYASEDTDEALADIALAEVDEDLASGSDTATDAIHLENPPRN